MEKRIDLEITILESKFNNKFEAILHQKDHKVYMVFLFLEQMLRNIYNREGESQTHCLYNFAGLKMKSV